MCVHALFIGTRLARKHQVLFISAPRHFHLERYRFPEEKEKKKYKLTSLAPRVVLKYPGLNRVGCRQLQEGLQHSTPTGLSKLPFSFVINARFVVN